MAAILTMMCLLSAASAATNNSACADCKTDVDAQVLLQTRASVDGEVDIVAEDYLVPAEAATEAVSVIEHEKRTVTSEQKEAGSKFLQGKYGVLSTLFVKAGVDMASYYAVTIYKAGQLNKEEPRRANLTAIMKEWRTELLKHTNATKCPEDPLDMESCMQEMRCLIEPEVGKEDGVTAGFFASFMELEDQLAACFKDFEVRLGAPSSTVMYLCKGELGNEDGGADQEIAALMSMPQSMVNEHNMESMIQQFEASSERQRTAVAAVAAIHRAADLTERAAAATHHTALNEWQDIWHPACAALGCDPNSFVDISQAMHDHAAELLEVEAPAAAIRIYVRAMRKASLAQKHWIGKAANIDEKFRDGISKPAHHAMANKRYGQHLKQVGGMIDGAYMELKRSSVQLTWFWSCWGVLAHRMKAYGKKFFPGSIFGVVLSLTSGVGSLPATVLKASLTRVLDGVGSESLPSKTSDYCGSQTRTRSGKTCQKWTAQSPHGHSNTPDSTQGMGLGDHNYCRNPDGGPTIWCYTTSNTRWEACDPKPEGCVNHQIPLKFGVLIGLVPGSATTTGYHRGISTAAGATFQTCNANIYLSIQAGLAGALVWPGTDCTFGPNLSGFGCADRAISGMTFFCCKINLLNGDNDC